MRYSHFRTRIPTELIGGIFAGWILCNLMSELCVSAPDVVTGCLSAAGVFLFAGSISRCAVSLLLSVGGTWYLFRLFFAPSTKRIHRRCAILVFLYGFLYSGTVTFYIRHFIKNIL
jgi:hypothetical protein